MDSFVQLIQTDANHAHAQATTPEAAYDAYRGAHQKALAGLQGRLLAWANELEDISWYDAVLARTVGKHLGSFTPAEWDALDQLREKYPDVTLIADIQLS